MHEASDFSSVYDLVSNLDKIKDKNYLTHNIHPYPAKFIPQLPNFIIKKYSNCGDTVLDPFCGSGTALLESILMGRNAVGVDINPIALLISKIKTCVLSNLDIRSLGLVAQKLIEPQLKIKRDPGYLSDSNIEELIPDFLNRDHWFQKNMQMELAFIKNCIKNDSETELAKEYLLLCLSAVIVKASNQESDTRWRAVDKNLPDCFAITSFLKILKENIQKTFLLEDSLSRIEVKSNVFQIEVSELQKKIENSSIDLVVTSPPYLNSYDYYLYHKLRMFWLGYDHKSVQKAEIGSRNKHCDNNEGVDVFVSTMQKGLIEISKALKKGGICAIVVGDSIFKGQLIDMSLVYKEICSNAGLNFEEQASFDQRKYTRAFTPNLKRQFKKSHILIFRKRHAYN